MNPTLSRRTFLLVTASSLTSAVWGATGSKTFTLLSYNAQLGVRGWTFLEELFKTRADAVCLQRFPEKWLSQVKEKHVYQKAFPSADNGCLTLLRGGRLMSQGNSSPTDYGLRKSQSTAFIEGRHGQWTVVNTLGPYPSKEEGVTEAEYKTHLEFVFRRPGPALIAGDMHFDSTDFKELKFNGFKNYAKTKNFTDQQGRGLNLTKLFANVSINIQESVLSRDSNPQRHHPVLFEVKST